MVNFVAILSGLNNPPGTCDCDHACNNGYLGTRDFKVFVWLSFELGAHINFKSHVERKRGSLKGHNFQVITYHFQTFVSKIGMGFSFFSDSPQIMENIHFSKIYK